MYMSALLAIVCLVPGAYSAPEGQKRKLELELQMLVS